MSDEATAETTAAPADRLVGLHAIRIAYLAMMDGSPHDAVAVVVTREHAGFAQTVEAVHRAARPGDAASFLAEHVCEHCAIMLPDRAAARRMVEAGGVLTADHRRRLADWCVPDDPDVLPVLVMDGESVAAYRLPLGPDGVDLDAVTPEGACALAGCTTPVMDAWNMSAAYARVVEPLLDELAAGDGVDPPVPPERCAVLFVECRHDAAEEVRASLAGHGFCVTDYVESPEHEHGLLAALSRETLEAWYAAQPGERAEPYDDPEDFVSDEPGVVIVPALFAFVQGAVRFGFAWKPGASRETAGEE